MPKLRGAVIGCGYFSQFHVEAWRRINEVEIVAACDPQIDRARAVASRAFADPEAMFDSCKLDFVDVATRPESHLALSAMAAGSGVNVICQKPMAPTLAGARAMTESAAAAGVRMMIHDNWRWQPWYRHAAAITAAGGIGRPISYSFRMRKRDGLGNEPYGLQPYFREMPRLLIYEVLVHHIDTARFLFGDIESVYALSRRRNERIAGEDQAVIAMRHRDSVDGTIDGHRFTDILPDGPVMGDAAIDGDEGALTILSSGDVLVNGQIEWHNDVTTGYRGDSVLATQRHFVECMQSGARFETDAVNYLETYRTAEAAYESISERRCVLL